MVEQNVSVPCPEQAEMIQLIQQGKEEEGDKWS